MDFNTTLNMVILIAFLGFIGYEGRDAYRAYREHKRLVEKLSKTKKIEVHKDYKMIVIAYVVMALVIVVNTIYYIEQKSYSLAAISACIPFFCIIFIFESMMTRTYVFYDTGFLCGVNQIKYRSILKVTDKKKFLRGYELKLTSDEVTYVTKKIRPILEEHLKEFKDRKKHKHEK